MRRLCLTLLLLAAACGDEAAAPAPPAESAAPAGPAAGAAGVDDERLRAAGAEHQSWLSYGRTYDEQRYSPLAKIDAANVRNLALDWTFDTRMKRGHEATPLVVNGRMYLTGPWSVVFALDARTGERVWTFDPGVPREYGQKACCDVVNRGVALYKGRIYSGVLDGRLVALDAQTGALVWEVLTVDREKPYTITGAPRIVEGKVVIGNGGAELGVRGYVSAYDAETGELVWRTYTVPGNPDEPFESPALERAAATWKGGNWWEIGGGGTVWDSIVFDPDLRLLYVGTGNGSPWTRHIRSPGGGDNLYLSSILALDPDDGSLIWHYQTTPGDNWDFTATQPLMLAELEIEGRPRKVIMQAPKNGFFYVLDRETGELISAEKYVTVTWASHVDMETGRPVEVAGQDYKDGLALVQPTAFGGHNWHPMSYNPRTGLVYIPAQEIMGLYRLDPDFEYRPGAWNTGTDMNVFSLVSREAFSGHLLAWDPVEQREVWRQQYGVPWNGGTLTTGGNLVFQGTADGRFVAYRADDGAKLWESFAGTGIIAAPITYLLDGEQRVTVVAGWGGAFALAGGPAAEATGVHSTGKVLTFKLGGELPPLAELEQELDAPGAIRDGERLYHAWCAVCHGGAAVSGGVLPDLRKSDPSILEAYPEIVLKGILAGNGMPNLSRWLDAEQVELIRAYVLSRREEAG